MVAEPRVSLARRFGPVVSASISVLLLCSHALFAFAQYASALEDCPTLPQLPNFTSACDATNQLLLARVDANVHVGFEARGLIATALGYVEQQQCNTSCPEEYPAVSQLSPLCSMLACDSCTSVGPIDLAVGGCHGVPQVLPAKFKSGRGAALVPPVRLVMSPPSKVENIIQQKHKNT